MNKKAFTLVELIVVMVILAILATITFIWLLKYPKDAEDSKTKYNLKNMEKIIKLYKIQQKKFPNPDNSTLSWTWIVWEFSTWVFQKVKKLSDLPIDSITDKHYKYSVSQDWNNFKIEWNLHNWELITVWNFE